MSAVRDEEEEGISWEVINGNLDLGWVGPSSSRSDDGQLWRRPTVTGVPELHHYGGSASLHRPSPLRNHLRILLPVSFSTSDFSLP